MRFINAIFTTATPGEVWSNKDIFPHYERAINALPLADEEHDKLMKAVRYFLMGERTRRGIPNWLDLQHFKERAMAFETSAEAILDTLAEQITQATEGSGIVFDAILTTTSTGNLMPGLSYRLAHRLKQVVRPDSMMIDLGNVGCTGGIKALNLANQLDSAFENILVVSLELPSTVINWNGTSVDVWQGQCTFGDGAAALWVSKRPELGEMALKLEQIKYVQQAATGLNLIRWGYSDYYTFRLANEKTFNRDIQAFVAEALWNTESIWRQTTHWAIHPAGITLLLRLSRKLGLPREALSYSVAHYEKFSNMSSASILHILKDIAVDVPVGTAINLVTMGAGLNVIYGCVKKEKLTDT
ncbi:MAG: hypothetical protein DRR19_25605 [Candidatus Parabeggiatoa sp. nov. 1]|nr:MAG: hypothetical protein DRR19_25605 [Gammaproteobacteria bacterium]